MAIKTPSILNRDLVVLENETNPDGSDTITIYPSTTLDQVFDNKSANNKTLRIIIEDLRQEIITGGRGDIHFPVTSVNNKTGNVVLNKADINLDNVDNTSDNDKPLSEFQRIAIYEILANYDFHIDVKRFDDHLIDMDNPHGVTLDQLNTNHEVDDYIANKLRIHSQSNDYNVHGDIRVKIDALDEKVTRIQTDTERIVSAALDTFRNHTMDPTAHSELFVLKEDTENKVSTFNTIDNTTYPTTDAVSNYITDRLADYRATIDREESWISDIIVVDNRAQLPVANRQNYRKTAFIKNGISSHPEIAVCRQDATILTDYSWDIKQLSTFSKIDTRYLEDSAYGLTVKIQPIADQVLDDGTVINAIREKLDVLMPQILSNYYTKAQIDAKQYIGKLKIVPGSANGTIRYYVDDDITTMSSNVLVAGLQRNAFLEWISENEIADDAIRANHITSNAVKNRHISNKAVTYQKMSASYMRMLGNLLDATGNSVQEVTLEALAAALRPYIEAIIEEYMNHEETVIEPPNIGTPDDGEPEVVIEEPNV